MYSPDAGKNPKLTLADMMSLSVVKQSIRILYFLLLTALFALGFYRNQWQVLPMEDVLYRREISEMYIIGRLVKSHQDGVFSEGGLLGFGDVSEGTVEGRVINNQYRKYEKGIKFDQFWAYRSHPGFQGMVYSLIDSWTDFAPSTNLSVFRFGISTVLALTVAGICMWFLLEFGWIASISAAGFVLISRWLALLGGNLFWSLWSFYLPLLAISFLLHVQKSRREYVVTFRFAMIVFLLALVKILFSGFEFITSGLLMMTVPLIYYAVLDQWEWKSFLRGLVNMGMGLAASVVAGLLILGFQIKTAAGSYKLALEHIVFSWRNRTYGNDVLTTGVAKSFGEVIGETLDLLEMYLNGHAFSLSTRYPVPSAFLTDLLDGRYLYLIALFAAASAMLVFVYRHSRVTSDRRAALALIAASWYSILSTFSWLVIFRDHARGHTLLDFIVWQMPFTLYGFAMIGFSLSSWIRLQGQDSEVHV